VRRLTPSRLLALVAIGLVAGCDADVKRADPPPVERPSTVERLVLFDVAGSTGAALDRAITLGGHPGAGGRRYGGNTDCNLRYRYRPEARDLRCRVVEVISEGEIVYTLPRWVDEDAADRALRDRWRAFRAALEAHERGHGRLCGEAVLEVRERILALPEAPRCDALRDAAQRAFTEVLGRFSRSSDDYDVRTDHGATEGASTRALYR
jgi:predicted secreted Zn-dependent protease